MRHQPFLLDWADRTGLAVRTSGQRSRRSGASARGEFITAAPSFEVLFPPSAGALPDALRLATRSIVDAFIALEATLTGADREVAILALSTCPTYADYAESLSAELEVWLQHPEFSAARIAAELVDESRGALSNAQRAAFLRKMHESARTLAQERKKTEAYNRRAEVVVQLDRLFAAEAPLGVHSPTWELYLRPRLNLAAPDDTRSTDYLLHALELGRRGMTVIRAIASLHGIGPPRTDPLKDSINSFNELLERAADFYYEAPASLDPADLLPLDRATSLVEAAKFLVRVERAIGSIWETWRYPLGPRALVVSSEDVAILMWDISDSSQRQDKVELARAIQRANDRLGSLLEDRDRAEFAPDLDDGNFALLPRARDALQGFLALREIFQREGLLFRAAIDTTVNNEKLTIDMETGVIGGRPLDAAARILAVFKEGPASTTPPIMRDSRGAAQPLEPPAGVSYLLVTDDALAVLRREGLADLPLQHVATIEGYEPRMASRLPLNVSCFV